MDLLLPRTGRASGPLFFPRRGATWRALLALALSPALLSGCRDATSDPLPALQVDPRRVALVGVSAGAAMAQQVHLAYSDRVHGAVLVAAPPHGCAEGSLEIALSRCMKGEPAAPDPERLVAAVIERAREGDLAGIAGLAGDRVLLLHGSHDKVVAAPVAAATVALHRALPGVQVEAREGDFGHLWPTLEQGGDCRNGASPWLGRCGRDVAQEAMQFLFGLPPRTAATPSAGELLRFDQSGFAPGGADAFLDTTGFLYRPAQCDTPRRCGLLIAFHGCQQNAAEVGEAFVRDAGLNRWADVHDVVVLYPQVRATYMPLNPKACWDWWGYSGPEYDTRRGVQLRAVAAMAAALGAPLAD